MLRMYVSQLQVPEPGASLGLPIFAGGSPSQGLPIAALVSSP